MLVFGRHPLGQLLELKTVGEHQVIALRAICAERFVLLRGGSCLDVADMSA